MAPNSSPVVSRQQRFYSPISSGREADGEKERNRPNSNSYSFNDSFVNLCFNIALYLTNIKLGKRNTGCKYGQKMEELTRSMLLKHEMAFMGMTQRLQLNEHNIIESFEAVARESFLDGCNFGRIVATYGFFIVVLDYCLHHNMENKIDELQMAVTRIVSDQKEWINRNGGWVRTCLGLVDIICHEATTTR